MLSSYDLQGGRDPDRLHTLRRREVGCGFAASIRGGLAEDPAGDEHRGGQEAE